MDIKPISIIKVGGSILSLSDEVLFDFQKAKEIKDLLIPFTDKHRFILITGGGFICRKYQKLLKENGYPDFDQHYVGTCTCNLNAIMLRSVFGDLAEERIIAFNDFDNGGIKFEKDFLIGGAAHPGPSSDEDAVRVAMTYSAQNILSLKDIDGVYSADPDKDPNAKKLDKLLWNEYLDIIGNPMVHTPGGNLPIDPIAARKAQNANVSFVVLSGGDLNNIKSYLNEDSFAGTVVG